jgi:hypothetical protein
LAFAGSDSTRTFYIKSKAYMNIVNSQQKVYNNPQKRLAELHHDEIVFYKKRFVWSSNRSGFYTRTGYNTQWYPKKKYNGEWQHLYAGLVDDLVEKHLDLDRFCLTQPWIDSSPVRRQDSETAFWFGTMAGEYTYHDCLDIDSHERVGW